MLTRPRSPRESRLLNDLPIILLGPEDYGSLADLWAAAGLPSRPDGRDAKQAIHAQMRLPFCRFLGVRDRQSLLLGAAIANHEGRKGWINRLAVRPSARGAGIGRRLIAACEQWLFAEGILLVAALVEGENTVSQSLFAQCGYDRDDTLVYFRKPRTPFA